MSDIMVAMLKFFIGVILLVLFVASDGTYWGALEWVAEKRAERIERRLERVLDIYIPEED